MTQEPSVHNYPDDKAGYKDVTLNGSDTHPPEVEFHEPNIRRDRPFSASAVSRRTVGSVTSRASRSPKIQQNDYSVQHFFAYRPGVFEKAVEDIQAKLVVKEADGNFIGAWLLTEIDHWDCEQEKVVVLTDFSLISVRYDFIKLSIYKFEKLLLERINKIQVGDIMFPEKSWMPARRLGAVRVYFGKEDPAWYERWNPFSSMIPYWTFTHHPLSYFPAEAETVTYNVDEMHDSLIVAARDAHKTMKVDGEVEFLEGPIIVETYASLTSMIYNQSMLGYSKERGGVSY